MTPLIHLLMTAGATRTACGINLTDDDECAEYDTHGALVRVRKIDPTFPEVCVPCIVAGRKP